MATDDLRARSTAEVFEDHLELAQAGDTDADIERNYAPDVVLLTGIGVLTGHDGVRRSRSVLAGDVPGGDYAYVTRLCKGDYAFVEWTAKGNMLEVDDGADGFVIRDGWIVAQNIHYTVRHRTGYHEQIEHERVDEGGPAPG